MAVSKHLYTATNISWVTAIRAKASATLSQKPEISCFLTYIYQTFGSHAICTDWFPSYILWDCYSKFHELLHYVVWSVVTSTSKDCKHPWRDLPDPEGEGGADCWNVSNCFPICMVQHARRLKTLKYFQFPRSLWVRTLPQSFHLYCMFNHYFSLISFDSSILIEFLTVKYYWSINLYCYNLR
jgi:hypothetical protein